ncbi:MAG: hypothetical protein AB1898_30740 [Acidobacteriota bacterium]
MIAFRSIQLVGLTTLGVEILESENLVPPEVIQKNRELRNRLLAALMLHEETDRGGSYFDVSKFATSNCISEESFWGLSDFFVGKGYVTQQGNCPPELTHAGRVKASQLGALDSSSSGSSDLRLASKAKDQDPIATNQNDYEAGVEILKATITEARLDPPTLQRLFDRSAVSVEVSAGANRMSFVLSDEFLEDLRATKSHRETLARYIQSVKGRIRNVAPDIFYCLSHEPVEIAIEWPIQSLHPRAASFVRVDVRNLRTGLVAQCAAIITYQLEKHEQLNHDPFLRELLVINSVRRRVDRGELHLASKDNLPDTLTEIKVQGSHEAVAPVSDDDVRQFLAEKVYWLGFKQGNKLTRVWIADPWDAKYLGVDLGCLLRNAQVLEANQVIKLFGEYAASGEEMLRSPGDYEPQTSKKSSIPSGNRTVATSSRKQQVDIIRIVAASPSDVQEERDRLPSILEEINDGIAGHLGLRLELSRWETDAYPGFHVEGPQGLVDAALDIEECDVVIGIFWKRFGTPVSTAQSGTEHELRRAYEAWKQKRTPQIMVYFNQQAYTPGSPEETDQWSRVLQFKRDFPQEGFWWNYNGVDEFERTVRKHLTRFVRSFRSGAGVESNKSMGLINGETKEVEAEINLARKLRERAAVAHTDSRLAQLHDEYIEWRKRAGNLIRQVSGSSGSADDFMQNPTSIQYVPVDVGARQLQKNIDRDNHKLELLLARIEGHESTT